ncbi:hypothetical protein GFS24_10345 [Chitinophaga sp. SYP-B3965]|uniref:helix-turn-helix domain-containing protein n=1 Tax=Chitinophaga sp. SYP-B3965 TaxID=2663120 RepID=UPI001299B95D|nr:helix-turn-helix domain-containing protein [Chitinophaga sp. SYP-B3965]MRG45516.1 hypothetical protein [Chitinophaga sp. SYP-B3965]
MENKRKIIKALLFVLEHVAATENEIQDKTGLPLVLQWRSVASSPEQREKLINQIILTVCTGCGITPAQLQEQNRKTILPVARQLICYFSARIIPDISIKEIGIAIDKNHSTVIHNIDQVNSLIDIEDEIIMSVLENILPAIIKIKESLKDEQQ